MLLHSQLVLFLGCWNAYFMSVSRSVRASIMLLHDVLIGRYEGLRQEETCSDFPCHGVLK